MRDDFRILPDEVDVRNGFFNFTFSDIRTSFIILILETGRAQPIPAIDLLTKSSRQRIFRKPDSCQNQSN